MQVCLMKVTVNGQHREIGEPSSLSAALAMLGFDNTRGLAVAVEGEVIPRARWGGFRLTDGARMEILRAVQGG